MTIAQFIVAYAVCWWMVLFMMLPNGVQPEANPGLGHARSAPRNPNLRHKFRRTTLVAFLPTALIYLISTSVQAAEGEYHIRTGCKPLATHIPKTDVSARDGQGTQGKPVVSATLGDSNPLDVSNVAIPLEIPSAGYLNRNAPANAVNATVPASPEASAYNVDLSHSFINAGTLNIHQDGTLLMNGKRIDSVQTNDCEGANEE